MRISRNMVELVRLFKLPKCVHCKNFIIDLDDTEKYPCKAFPDGIPNKIQMGEADHTKPFPGDHGIQFEAL